jgi:hypothetical protein
LVPDLPVTRLEVFGPENIDDLATLLEKGVRIVDVEIQT